MANEVEVEVELAQPDALNRDRFSGAAEFQTAVRDFLKLATQQQWQKLILSDPDFVDWPLGEVATIQILSEWAGPGRSLVMLAGDYEGLRRRHARFVRWRRNWSHIIDCRRTPPAEAQATPSAIWGDRAMLHRFDVDFSTGLTSTDPMRRVRLRQELGEWIASSSPAFPASTLGL